MKRVLTRTLARGNKGRRGLHFRFREPWNFERLVLFAVSAEGVNNSFLPRQKLDLITAV